MPNKPKTHDDCRLLCCILCKRTLKDNRKLTVGNKILIKTNFVPNYDDVHQFLPGGTCGACRRLLTMRFGQKSDPKSGTLPFDTDPKYFQNIIEELSQLPSGIGIRIDCTCSICVPSKTPFLSENKTSGVPKPTFTNTSSRDNRTLDQSRVQEVTQLMKKLTPKTKDFLVNARIKEKEQEKSSDSPLKFGSATGGKPMSVVGPKARKRLYDSKAPIPAKTFENIASGTDLSAKKLASVAKEFRSSQGRSSIES